MGIKHWSKTTLKKLCFRIGDGLHGTPKYSHNSNLFFINGNNLNNGKIEITDKTNSVTSDEYQNNFIELNKNTLLLSINGTLGSLAFYNNEKVMLGKSVAYLNFKNDINHFYYYYFQLKDIQDYFYNVATGSTIKNLSLKSIQDFVVPVPSDIERKLIVNVLFSLDKKIELNNQINQKLEAMAKTLYDYWFVQFDFPDANGKPYKSSGGKMVYSEELKREIPEGWTCLKLEEIIAHSGTGLNPRQNFKLGYGNNYYVTIKNIKQGRVILDSKCDRIDDKALEIINKRSDLKAGDILFTSIQPVGVTYLIHEKPKNWNINESVFVIRPNYNSVSSDYLYMLLSSEEMKLFTTNSSAGSIHKGIRHTVLKTFQFPFSNKKTIEKFTKILHPLLRKMYANEQETQKLTQLRDWLLPMLMNGQVKVLEADDMVQEALMAAEPKVEYGKSR